MKQLHLLAVGSVQALTMEELRAGLEAEFHLAAQVLPFALDPVFALHAERRQYHSSEILGRMQGFVRPDTWRLLGITASDLYIPILTFVFGEAQMGGNCALVSGHRLRQEFYGLPPDDELFRQRLLKEAVHELGHTMELTHCDEYECVMSASHGVEWIDVKSKDFCESCWQRVFQ